MSIFLGGQKTTPGSFLSTMTLILHRRFSRFFVLYWYKTERRAVPLRSPPKPAEQTASMAPTQQPEGWGVWGEPCRTRRHPGTSSPRSDRPGSPPGSECTGTRRRRSPAASPEFPSPRDTGASEGTQPDVIGGQKHRRPSTCFLCGSICKVTLKSKLNSNNLGCLACHRGVHFFKSHTGVHLYLFLNVRVSN